MMKLKKKKQLQKNSKEKIEVKRMVIKFERKQLKGFFFLHFFLAFFFFVKFQLFSILFFNQYFLFVNICILLRTAYDSQTITNIH